MSSLTFYLQMAQICEKYNVLAEGVKQKAPGSVALNRELAAIHRQIEHLRAGIKDWNRLLSSGAIPRVPTNSLTELQGERSRIFQKLQLLESELNIIGPHNAVTTLAQHQHGRMRSPVPEDAWNAFHPQALGRGMTRSAMTLVAPNPNGHWVPSPPGEIPSGWFNCSQSSASTESDYDAFFSSGSSSSIGYSTLTGNHGAL